MKKIYKKTAISFFLSATILGAAGNALASPIQWETFSKGVTIDESDTVRIKPDTATLFENPENIYGAGFFTPEGGCLTMEISIFNSDMSLIEFEHPRFIVATSPEGFTWNKEIAQLTIFDSWNFPLDQAFKYATRINLIPQSYLSFFLETEDKFYGYLGLGRFSFVANTPTPVPEPNTLMLFGIGLVGLSFISGKIKK